MDFLPDVEGQVGGIDVAEGALAIGEADDFQRDLKAIDGDGVAFFDAFVLEGGGHDDFVLGFGGGAAVRGGALFRQPLWCDEGVGLYSEEGEVDGLAVLVVSVCNG